MLRNNLRYSVSICLLLLALVLLTGCFSFEEKVEISWFDTDGELIESASFVKSYDPTSRELPEDSDEWHYTEWSVTQAGQVTVCTAKRVAKSHIVWKDHDGNVLNEAFFVEDEEDKPTLSFPRIQKSGCIQNGIRIPAKMNMYTLL